MATASLRALPDTPAWSWRRYGMAAATMALAFWCAGASVLPWISDTRAGYLLEAATWLAAAAVAAVFGVAGWERTAAWRVTGASRGQETSP